MRALSLRSPAAPRYPRPVPSLSSDNPVTKRNIYIRRGDTYRRVCRVLGAGRQPLSLVGWTFRGQLRGIDNITLLATFACTVLDAAAGLVEFLLTLEQTEALAEVNGLIGVYEWDFTTPAGDVQTFLEGYVFVSEKTRRD